MDKRAAPKARPKAPAQAQPPKQAPAPAAVPAAAPAVLVPPAGALTAILLIGIFFGAFANGSLFHAMGLAPNPGLPPVIYATASLVVFGLSAALATSVPLFVKHTKNRACRNNT